MGEERANERLKWWFRVVGVIYVLLGIGFIPLLNVARIPLMLPGFDAPAGGVASVQAAQSPICAARLQLRTGRTCTHRTHPIYCAPWFLPRSTNRWSKQGASFVPC